MATPRTASEILDREFLTTRGKLLEIASAFDRIDRAVGREDLDNDPRHRRCLEAVAILGGEGPDRAERIQRLFSDEYREGWLQELAPARRR